ncbi:hypothetical protein DFQ27_003806 [Actinomortierella ambigua]|uniref:Uncharacterized protein n=1 Tax=Actinomortierella ambigua TaxID=1343610 RepID=A0A9P6Q5M3_9FUNG|nr:hypothetical protein DFQ27_003806 [Actinomortierella ambigua]
MRRPSRQELYLRSNAHGILPVTMVAAFQHRQLLHYCLVRLKYLFPSAPTSTRSDGIMPVSATAATSTSTSTSTTTTTVSTRGGAVYGTSSTETKLAQSDALSVYGPSFRKILCANPRGRSLKKIVEMKAFQLKRRQAEKAMGRTHQRHVLQDHSPGSSARIEMGTASRSKASRSPNDQLVPPRRTWSQHKTNHGVGEPDALEDDDKDYDEDEDEDEDLDADWVKEMLMQMEGECYYGDMPYELLHVVFGNFLKVSMDSLKRLAEQKRAQAVVIKTAERELEERWSKTPLLPVNPVSKPWLSQKHRPASACDLCQHLQHARRSSSPTSAPHAIRTRYRHQRHTSSAMHSHQHISPNTVHEQLPPIGRQFLAHHFASSPPSPGYTSSSSSDAPHFTTYSNESDPYLGDEGGSRSELDSEAYSGEEDDEMEEDGNRGHHTHQGESESIDNLVASLSIGHGYQPDYTSEDMDAQSIGSNDATEHGRSIHEARSGQTMVIDAGNSVATARAHATTDHSSIVTRTRSNSISSTASSALAGYSKAGRDDSYHRRLRHHQHYHRRHHLHSVPHVSGQDSTVPHCHCQRECDAHYWPKELRAFHKSGINRIGDDQDEESTLHELHRDQYFHPITHVALRSDLYVCSLVNRQWRLAALRLMWQSVVLDVESCHLERSGIVDCTCHLAPTDVPPICMPSSSSSSGSRSPRLGSRPSTSTSSRSRSHNHVERSPLLFSSSYAASSSSASSSSSFSTSSSSTTSPRISRHFFSPSRTRLETMLDSYLELYGLDLAKSVQTVELDLQLLASWSLNDSGISVNIKRILHRLAPFNHLRLISAQHQTASDEENAANFRFVMEGLYGNIHHLHFSPGFAISRVWVQEMDRMPRLQKLTIESLNSMERVDYDWSRIRQLVLHAIIPSSLFGIPRPIPISSTPPTPPPTPHTFHENGGTIGPGLMSLLPASSSIPNSSAVNGGLAMGIGSMVADQALPAHHPFLTMDSTFNSLNTTHGTSSFVLGTPPDTLFHVNNNSPISSLITSMASSYTHPNPTQHLLHHPVAKLVRQLRPGWWLWNGLRRLEIQMKNVVLPREWLQELVAVLSHRARAEQDLMRMHEQETNVLRRPSASSGSPLAALTSGSSSKFEVYQEHLLQERLCNMYGLGPRIEVFHLDCEVSHPHKEILMDLMTQWGHQLKEFYFSQSAELTDEFFWCCLQHGKNLRRLSLRDSKGITGEGVEVSDPHNHYDQHFHHRPPWMDQWSSVVSKGEERKSAAGGSFVLPSTQADLDNSELPESSKTEHGHHSDQTTVESVASLSCSPTERATSEARRATPKVVIRWRRDFEELRLDQSRVRSECLVALKQHCPGMRYKVRDVRWSNGQRKPDQMH